MVFWIVFVLGILVEGVLLGFTRNIKAAPGPRIFSIPHHRYDRCFMDRGHL